VLPALLGLGETSNRRNPCEARAARMRFLTVARMRWSTLSGSDRSGPRNGLRTFTARVAVTKGSTQTPRWGRTARHAGRLEARWRRAPR